MLRRHQVSTEQLCAEQLTCRSARLYIFRAIFQNFSELQRFVAHELRARDATAARRHKQGHWASCDHGMTMFACAVCPGVQVLLLLGHPGLDKYQLAASLSDVS